jgi:hypothetical protein
MLDANRFPFSQYTCTVKGAKLVQRRGGVTLTSNLTCFYRVLAVAPELRPCRRARKMTCRGLKMGTIEFNSYINPMGGLQARKNFPTVYANKAYISSIARAIFVLKLFD